MCHFFPNLTESKCFIKDVVVYTHETHNRLNSLGRDRPASRHVFSAAPPSTNYKSLSARNPTRNHTNSKQTPVSRTFIFWIFLTGVHDKMTFQWRGVTSCAAKISFYNDLTVFFHTIHHWMGGPDSRLEGAELRQCWSDSCRPCSSTQP